MKRWQKHLYLTAFVVSLLLHFGSGIVMYLKRDSKPKSEAVEITLVDKKKTLVKKTTSLKNDARQIVEQSEKRINDEKDEKAKYLSRFDQKVIHETRAANSGKFQNDAKQGLAKKNVTKKSEDEKLHEKNAPKTVVAKKQPSPEKNSDGLPRMASLKPQFHWEKSEAGVQDPGLVSQTDDHLKDLQTGPQTLLSSREFVYYSYYARIKERLRLFWEPKIKEKITRLFMSGRHIASSDEKITRLVITLDEKGKLVKVQVLGESGLKDLDDAAIEAFQLAAPFPNPPSGIVESDHTIKIRWDFILEASASRFGPPGAQQYAFNRDTENFEGH